MADSTLQAIRTKIRRLTRTPSEAQMTDAQIDEYVNTFLLYDFPSDLRLFSLRTTLNFYTQPGVDVYDTNTTDPLDPLYNFKNKYIAIHPTAYVAGIPAFYTQWRDIFYGNYPQVNFIQETGALGNGTIGPFVGVIPPQVNGNNALSVFTLPHILQRSVIFTALDAAGTAMILVDTPTSNVLGNLTVPNGVVVLGTINYITGAYTINFPAATMNADNNPIIVESINYVPGKPLSILYYDNKFTVRPVPDKAYQIQIEADIRPTELLNAGSIPQIEQWWQYIAFYTAKKIFEERMDYDSINMMMPSLKEQESFVLRTSLTQQANERTVTIYSSGKSYGWGWGWNNNFPF